MLSEIIIKSLISKSIKEASQIHSNNQPTFVKQSHYKPVSNKSKVDNDPEEIN